MVEMIFGFLLGSTPGWWLFAVLGAGGAGAVWWFFPSLRVHALAAALALFALASAYSKGSRDRAKKEAARSEKAVKRVQERYDEIDRNPISDSDVARRLRDGTF